jgi:hypothetical protein
MCVRSTLCLLLYAAMLGCGTATPSAIFDASQVMVDASNRAVGAAQMSAQRRATWEATSRLHSSLPRATTRDELVREAFLLAVSRRDVEMTARLRAVWIPPPDDLKVSLALIELAMRAVDYDSARSQAWAALERFEDERPALMRIWYRTFAADPTFLADDVMTLAVPGPVDTIDYLGGGSSLTFRFRRNGATIAAFKPMQTRLQSNYRSEVAAYRLCSLMNCRFQVPHNREVRISRQDFLALNGVHTRGEAERFHRRYEDLVWFEDEMGDRWLHGTMKEWIPEFRLFGIEFRSLWRPLVQHDRSLDDEATLEHTMAQVFNTSNRTRLRPTGDLGDLTWESLGRQLSNIHVFDLMLNNWDRYSRHYTGVNCQWHRDEFVSIDNGAAFPNSRSHRSPASRVAYNFEQIEVFSESTVNAIEWMEPTALFPILFPPSEYHSEKATFASLMQRRKVFLERLEELYDEFGRDAVLAYD